MSDAPTWFTDTLAVPGRPGAVTVEGAEIRYLEWGARSAPGLVLVHGGAAHARWWDHLAPFLADRHHVVALNLSGHGDSDRRDRYHPEAWAQEVLAVARHAGIDGPPVLVGHSMGGFVSIVAAATYGDDLAGTIVVDSALEGPDPEVAESRGGRMFRAPKTYPDLDTAAEHFHLVPPQPVVTPYVVEHVARHSLRETSDGWVWKFDPTIFRDVAPMAFGDYLARARCRMAVVYGELSPTADPRMIDRMSDLLGRNAPFVEIPAANHHLILDQPLAFIAATRALLADWEHTQPAHAAWRRSG